MYRNSERPHSVTTNSRPEVNDLITQYANYIRPQRAQKLRVLIIGGDTNVLFDYVNSLEPYTILHTYNTLIPKCVKYDIEYLTKPIFNSFNIIVILDNSFNYLLNELIITPTQIHDVFATGKLKILKHKYTKYIHLHDTQDISKLYSIVNPNSVRTDTTPINLELKILKHKYTKYIHLHDTQDISKLYSIVNPNSVRTDTTPINLELKKEYSFCFIVSSYNNETNIIKNLESIIYQTHTNWRCIYINDASTDKTDELFHEILHKHNVKDKFTYLKNDIQLKQSYCKYIAYQLLNDFEIVCLLDGDDWLYNENVLHTIQTYYKKNDIKILTSNYVIYYEGNVMPAYVWNDKSIYSEIDKQYNTIRYLDKWLFRHLKTGLSILFKSISKEYLMFENQWLDRCTDCAEMFCISEYANSYILQVPDILYVYNKDNSLLYPSSYYLDTTNVRVNILNYLKTLPKCKYALPNTYIINLKSELLHKYNMSRQMDYISNPNYFFIEAIDGKRDEEVNTLFVRSEHYFLNNTQYKVIQNKPNLYNNTKRHCTKPVIGLIKSIERLCLTIKDKEDTHVLVLEDDIYTLKDFNENLYMNSKLLKDIDVLYLGCHNNNTCIYNNINSDVIFNPCNEYSFLIYGGYSIILSKRFTDYLLKTNFVSFCLRANMSWDVYLNYIRSKKIFNFCIYYKQLFIPNVYKDGIQSARGDDFYKLRNINMKDYNL
jgi:glycosyltransferase involved in cell wall biosynthesis